METPAQRRGKYITTIAMYQAEIKTLLMKARRQRYGEPTAEQLARIITLREWIATKKQMMRLEDEMDDE